MRLENNTSNVAVVTNIEKQLVLRVKINKMMEAAAAPDQDSVTNISNWPEEMILLLFRYLPRKDLVKVSEVSKRFRDLSQDGSLWPLELTLDFSDIEQKTLSCVGTTRGLKYNTSSPAVDDYGDLLGLFERTKQMIQFFHTNQASHHK